MISESSEVKLLDFGLAKLSGLLVEPAWVGQSSLGPESSPQDLAQKETLEAGEEPPADDPEQATPAETLPVEKRGKSAKSAKSTKLGKSAKPNQSPSEPPEPLIEPLTRAGAVMGTPAYMAPEAWRGLAATPMTDVYSLGAVLYELCTGRPPHYSTAVAQIEQDALHKDVEPLATLLPEIDGRFASLVDRCLRRNPTERPQSGVEVQEVLGSLLKPSLYSLLSKALRQSWPLVLLTVLLVLGGSLAGMYHLAQVVSRQQESPVLQARRVVAVLGPVSESRNQADSWYATAIGELLVRELALGERLRMVASRSVQRMLQESQLRETKQLDLRTLAQVRKRLDAEIVITGSYQLQGATEGQLQLSLLAQDTETGQILARSVVAGRATEVFGLVAQAGQIIRRQLGVEDGVAQHATGLRVANPDTLKRYGEALRELRGFRLREAGEMLSRVVSSDPDFSPAYEALATVWRSLGYDVKAREVLKHAVEHTTGMQREERLLLEARYQESLKNWERALATYQTLMRLFPDNPEYPLAYGEAQLASGGHQAAIATLTQLQLNNDRAQLDPRIDAALARALEDKGDFRAAHERYEAAIAKSRAIGATLLVARCLVAQAYVKKFLGEAQGVLPNLEMAIAMFRQAGAQLDVADALAAKGWILRDRGDAKQAFAVFYDALAILLDAGSGNGTAIHLGNLALLLLRAGDLSLATARAEASLVLSREVDYKEAYATALLSLGWIDLYRAQLDAATGRAQQAARIAKEQGDELLGAWSNWLLGETLLLRGELGPAREKHKLALEQRSVVGSRGFVAESRAALAYLELLSGNPAAAVAHAEQAVPLFHEDGQLDGEAWALAVFGAAQAASGHSPEALLLARQAETLNRANPYLPMRMTILCVLARIYAQLALREESERCLQEIAQVQRDARLVELPTKRLELALASARLRLVVAPGPEVLAALQSLRAEAEQAGILQVANDASQLLTRHQHRNQQGGNHAQ